MEGMLVEQRVVHVGRLQQCHLIRGPEKKNGILKVASVWTEYTTSRPRPEYESHAFNAGFTISGTRDYNYN
jgi:hypothetical protein